MTKAIQQADTVALPFASNDKPTKTLRDEVASAVTTVAAVLAPSADARRSRPLVDTRAGWVYAEGPEWDLYTELAAVQTFVKELSRALEHGDLSAAEVVAKIDKFNATLPACHKWVDTECLSFIRSAKQGDTEVILGPKLNRLRGICDHFDSAVAAALQDVPRPVSRDTVAPAETSLPPWEQRSKITLVNGRIPK